MRRRVSHFSTHEQNPFVLFVENIFIHSRARKHKTAWDQCIEQLGNRLTKNMNHQGGSVEEVIETANTVELHAAILEALREQCGLAHTFDAAKPRAAANFDTNVAVLRACWRERLFNNTHACEVEHDLPLTVFEDKVQQMRMGSKEVWAVAAKRNSFSISNITKTITITKSSYVYMYFYSMQIPVDLLDLVFEYYL